MDSNLINRRQVVGRLAATAVGMSILPAFSAPSSMTPTASEKLTDPKTKYPVPPFPGQSQPWPGLASKMDPVPDHGEKSYRGSGRLQGRKALITGGDSGMGRAAAIAYAREGADVAINYHPDEQPDADEVIALIKAEGRIGLAIPGDLRDEEFCKKLVEDAVSGLGGLDIVVSNAGRQQTHGAVRLDDEDQHLRALLDHQGRPAPSQARLMHHRHHLGTGDRSLRGPLRLRADEGGHHELRPVPGEAARAERYSGQRRGSGPDLDSPVGPSLLLYA